MGAVALVPRLVKGSTIMIPMTVPPPCRLHPSINQSHRIILTLPHTWPPHIKPRHPPHIKTTSHRQPLSCHPNNPLVSQATVAPGNMSINISILQHPPLPPPLYLLMTIVPSTRLVGIHLTQLLHLTRQRWSLQRQLINIPLSPTPSG
jgi:hypothetical protein